MVDKVYTHSTQWILDQIINDSTVAASFQTRFDLAKTNFESSLILNYENGIFKADQELIAFLQAASVIYKTKPVHLLDHRGVPVKITNVKEFCKKAVEIYTVASETYYLTIADIFEKRSQEV